jgi:hypothetical protein
VGFDLSIFNTSARLCFASVNAKKHDLATANRPEASLCIATKHGLRSL